MNEKTKRNVKQLLYVGVVCMAFYVLFPLWLTHGKDKVYEKDGICVYASPSVDRKQLDSVMLKAVALLKKHHITTDRKLTYIFCDTREDFKTRNLFISSDALAMNWPMVDCITYSPVDIKNNKLKARLESLNERPLSSVMAHEYVHTFQQQTLGFLKFRLKTMTEKWKTEGMAELVSESSSLPISVGMNYFLNKGTIGVSEDIKQEYFYFISRLKVDYLLNFKQTPLTEFWETKYDESALCNEIVDAMNKGLYQPAFQ